MPTCTLAFPPPSHAPLVTMAAKHAAISLLCIALVASASCAPASEPLDSQQKRAAYLQSIAQRRKMALNLHARDARREQQAPEDAPLGGSSTEAADAPGRRLHHNTYSCDPATCVAPDCLCASLENPGGFSREDTPMFVRCLWHAARMWVAMPCFRILRAPHRPPDCAHF